MTTATAFLVGLIDRETGQIAGYDVFSEETPTISFRFHPVTVLVGYGENYQEGLGQLRRMLDEPRNDWLFKRLGARALLSLEHGS